MDSNEGLGGGWFVVLGGKSSRESKNTCGEVGSGGEVNGGGDDFGVSKSLLGEIPGVVIKESDGETFGVNGGSVWHSVGGDSVWYGGDFRRGLLKQQGRTLIQAGEFCGKKLCLKFKIRVYNCCTVLPVLLVPFAKWNRLCFSMEPVTLDDAGNNF
ncbi:hypothetical protein Tco_0195836 [Tanacetum coccineum]